jgi:hypothetical protein
VEHPKRIGDRTTIAVMLALEANGYAIAMPFGENTRYDLVIDDGTRLSRVQCKTGKLRNGAVVFPTCSTYAHHPNPKAVRRDYLGQIDFFGVYCPQTAGVYLVPIEEANVTRSCNLRVVDARNGQKKAIRSAARYEIGVVASSAPRASSGARGSCA